MSDRASIRIGGVLRCCIQTANEIAPPLAMLSEGDTLRCSYCSSGLVFRRGAWEWPGGDFDWSDDDD